VTDNRGSTTAGHEQPRRGAVCVFGGAGGLGGAICRRLSHEFEAVFFTYRSHEQAAEALKSELGERCEVDCARVDLHDGAAVKSALEQASTPFRPLKAVVFSVGANIEQPFVSEIGDDEWRAVFDTEVFGFLNVAAAALPIFRAAQGGAFVNIGTFATRWYPPGDALSAVPKAATEMLCRAIAREEGRFGIRANTVAPGIIAAGLGAKLMQTTYDADVWEQQRKKVALRQFGRADDVANAVAFLAGEQSRYITGTTILVDGGLHL
jgi:NAD(P)-dependent dehydrogenase (short-subunit alcohol dehydrogenase family)